jgi:pSer/pThr/pTyr-binding forkhead associated (FHA) protein
MPRLIIDSQDGKRTIELAPGQTVTIGRDPSNTLPLPSEPKASRRHCRVSPAEGKPGAWEVADLGSTNKTRVNGAVAEHQVLAPGDTIEIGFVKIRFEDPEEEARLKEAGARGVCFLEWVTPERRGERILLTAPRTTVGRRETNAIALPQDRMASGHHAEIVRDLNGYTIRDLGSTNGTLVNGQPTTEAVLTHGARVRIGNAKFVFKDPSMKDIEVELAQFDEEAGWGMMGEIDLTRARGSRSGLVVVLVLFLAAGGGAWWLTQQGGARAVATVEEAGLVENGDFEADEIPWAAAGDQPVEIRRAESPGARGMALTLSLAGEEGAAPGLVTYGGDLPRLGGRPYLVRARLKGSGEGAVELVAVWENRPGKDELAAGATPLERSQVLARAETGWTAVDTRASPPAWASGGRLGVRLAPGARAVLDDVSVRLADADSDPPEIPLADFRRAIVNPDGSLDAMAMSTVLLAGAEPVARLADGAVLAGFRADGAPASRDGAVEVSGSFRLEGRSVPARISWSKTEEGLRAEVACAEAAIVGLAADLPAAHLGGVVNALGDFAPQTLPTTAGQVLGKVAKILAGEPDRQGVRPTTLVSFVAAGGRPEGILEVGATRDAGLVRLLNWVEGGSGTFDLVTDFARQQGAAKAALAAARAGADERPGVAARELRRIAQEFPFEKAVAKEAVALADTLEKTAQQEIDALAASLDRYRIYRSGEALLTVEKQATALTRQFLAAGGATAQPGPLETRVAELAEAAAAARREHDRQIGLPELLRLERVADLLGDDPAYRTMAVLYGRAILSRFGAWESEDSDLGRRVKALRARVETWQAETGVAAALPPPPPSLSGP